ncbi:MAG: histidine--tRNA ligase [Candidatus Aenigmarchaeota archaeon]|nr:histidine--tRNA ligase [Candidatus Aenigmarchaeota archaeon]
MREDVSPPKGFRDFQPEDEILRKEIFSRIEKIFQRYGFDPIETPMVEKWETLAGKYGEEAEKRLIWRFKLPYSEKEFGLRYDLTVPLARFVARFNPRFPFKVYQIGRVFRYEDPQKGRYREFWQCDVDIVGESSPLADAEILNIVIDVFEEFGFKNYTIKVNDRRILREIFEKFLGISDYSTILKIYRIIDKLDKIGKEKVLLLLKELNLGEKVLEQIESFIDASKLSNEEIFRYLESFDSSEIKVAIESLKTILDFSKKKDRIKIDLSLVRGLDYYTGMIYEAVVEEPKIGSLSGGGRYDNLIGIFTGNKIPAVGGSIGVERLIDAGLELGIFKKEKKTYSKVGIVYTKDVDVKKVWKIADYLRSKGINTFVPFEGYSGILDGVKDLDKRGIQFALIIGKKEIEEGKLTLQNLLTRERQVVKLEEIDKIVKG